MLTFGMDLNFLSTMFQPTLPSVILLNAYPVNLHSVPYSFSSRDSVTFKKVRQLIDNYGFTGVTMFPIVLHCTWETKSYDISFQFHKQNTRLHEPRSEVEVSSLIFTFCDPLIIFLLPVSTTLNSADLKV